MITDKSIKTFIQSLGHIPGCPTICAPKIVEEYKKGKYEFDFYVNPHNLCWYADDGFLYFHRGKQLKTFKVHIREIKLSELGI